MKLDLCKRVSGEGKGTIPAEMGIFGQSPPGEADVILNLLLRFMNTFFQGSPSKLPPLRDLASASLFFYLLFLFCPLPTPLSLILLQRLRVVEGKPTPNSVGVIYPYHPQTPAREAMEHLLKREKDPGV